MRNAVVTHKSSGIEAIRKHSNLLNIVDLELSIPPLKPYPIINRINYCIISEGIHRTAITFKISNHCRRIRSTGFRTYPTSGRRKLGYKAKKRQRKKQMLRNWHSLISTKTNNTKSERDFRLIRANRPWPFRSRGYPKANEERSIKVQFWNKRMGYFFGSDDR